MLNYKHLYYFTVIAKAQSLTQASKKLFITQPSLSGQLAQFEKYVGAKLFDRKYRKLVLNAAGEKVLDFAHQVFAMQDRLINDLNEDSLEAATPIHMGTLPSLSNSHIEELAVELLKNQNSQLSITEGDLNYLFDGMRNGQFHIVFADRPYLKSQHPYFVSKRVRQRKIVVVASPRLRKPGKNYPQSLSGCAFILPPMQHDLRREIELYFLENNISPRIKAEIDDASLIRLLLAKRPFVSILPYAVVKEAVAAKQLRMWSEIENIKSDMWCIYPARLKDQNPRLCEAIEKYVPVVK